MKKSALSGGAIARSLAIVGISGLMLTATNLAASANALLTDGTFANVTPTPSGHADPNTQTSASVCAVCGNPGASIQLVLDGTNATSTGFADIGMMDNVLAYNPGTQGAILSINGSYDRNVTQSNFTGSIPFIFRALIEQNGNYYLTQKNTGIPNANLSPANPSTGWVNLSWSGLTAADFGLYNFANNTVNNALHPDFAGASLVFGILGLASPAPSQVATSQYDNLQFEITSATPIPAALPLFASGLGALGIAGWRRKRKARAA